MEVKTLLAWGQPRTCHPHPQPLPPAPCKPPRAVLGPLPSHSSQTHFPPSLSSESVPPCQHPVSQSSQRLRPKHPNSSSRPRHLQAPGSVLHTRVSLHNRHCRVQGRRPGSEKAAGKRQGGAGCCPRCSASPTPASPVSPQGLTRAQTPKPQSLPTSPFPQGPSIWLFLWPDGGQHRRGASTPGISHPLLRAAPGDGHRDLAPAGQGSGQTAHEAVLHHQQ